MLLLTVRKMSMVALFGGGTASWATIARIDLSSDTSRPAWRGLVLQQHSNSLHTACDDLEPTKGVTCSCLMPTSWRGCGCVKQTSLLRWMWRGSAGASRPSARGTGSRGSSRWHRAPRGLLGCPCASQPPAPRRASPSGGSAPPSVFFASRCVVWTTRSCGFLVVVVVMLVVDKHVIDQVVCLVACCCLDGNRSLSRLLHLDEKERHCVARACLDVFACSREQPKVSDVVVRVPQRVLEAVNKLFLKGYASMSTRTARGILLRMLSLLPGAKNRLLSLAKRYSMRGMSFPRRSALPMRSVDSQNSASACRVAAHGAAVIWFSTAATSLGFSL